MAKQVLYVNGKPVTPRSTTRRNTILITLLIGWCVFITYSYIQVKTEVKMNTGSINNILCDNNEEYMRRLSQRESGGDFSIIGGAGNHYLGGFQFGRSAMEDIGLIENRRGYREFRRNFESEGVDYWSVDAQREACVSLMRKNKHYMRNHYGYIGKTINGVEVTEAGLLAACHLVGHRAVKNWLESNGRRDTRDAFGTSLVEYMNLMEGVQVSL